MWPAAPLTKATWAEFTETTSKRINYASLQHARVLLHTWTFTCWQLGRGGKRRCMKRFTVKNTTHQASNSKKKKKCLFVVAKEARFPDFPMILHFDSFLCVVPNIWEHCLSAHVFMGHLIILPASLNIFCCSCCQDAAPHWPTDTKRWRLVAKRKALIWPTLEWRVEQHQRAQQKGTYESSGSRLEEGKEPGQVSKSH